LSLGWLRERTRTSVVILRSFVLGRATKDLSVDPTERFFERRPGAALSE
jgi:hypothetical protein